jgi:CBS-domain-containing membrane protein
MVKLAKREGFGKQYVSRLVRLARALLDEHRINHLPVLLKGKLVGVLSPRDMQASKLSRMAPAIKRALETRPDRVRVASVIPCWLRMNASQASRCASSELKSCSRPSSEDFLV